VSLVALMHIYCLRLGVALRACALPMERTTGLRRSCLRHGVTFEHRQELPWAVKGEGMSVNEAVYTGTVWPDGRQRWGYGVVLLRPQRKWSELLCGRCGSTAVKCVLALCGGIACRLPVASQYLFENGGPLGTGWCYLGCTPFRPSFEIIKWTLPAIAALHPCDICN
jgi:hypothetical protein